MEGIEMALTRRDLVQRSGALGVGLAVGVPLGLWTTAGPARAQTDTQPGGILEAGFSSDIANLDPFVSALNNWVAVRNAVYETLVWADPADAMELKPLLAESWEWSPDFLQLTINLRPGVTYHDGVDFTAADVRFSIEKVMDPATASYLAGVFSAVESVEDVDPLTVRINLTRPSRPLLTGLSQVHIVSASRAATYTEEVVGTGPFKWVGWEPNVQIQVERNENYWMEGAPLLDGITWKLIPNVETMNATLQTGGVKWFNTPDLKDLERLQGDSNLEVVVMPPLERGYWIYNNMAKPPFDVQEVRQAISYAMDREAVVAAAISGHGVANCSYLAPNHPFHNPAVRDKYQYNLDRARELLAAGGYEDPSTLEFRLMVYGFNPAHVLVAQILQASLTEIGVKMEIEQVDIPTAAAKRGEGDWEMQIDGLGRISGDPHLEIMRGVVLQPGPQSLVGLRPGMYPEYDDLLARAEGTFDVEEQAQVYGELQEMIAEINPTLMVVHHAQAEVIRTELEGYQLHPWFFYNYRPMGLNQG
jgi:ABC-type transport system substrate-binding protein